LRFTVYELPFKTGCRHTHDIKAYDVYGNLVLHVTACGHAVQMEIDALIKRGFWYDK